MSEIVEVKNLIYEIRGFKVMIDSDLAELYGIEVRKLNQAVKRNLERFPEDFMFQITKEELENLNLKSQIVISSWGGRRSLPYAFTEQGVAMLSSVLRSPTAINVNIQIMRTFVNLRQWALENKDMVERLSKLEHYYMQHCKENEDDFRKIKEKMDLLDDRTKPSKIGF